MQLKYTKITHGGKHRVGRDYLRSLIWCGPPVLPLQLSYIYLFKNVVVNRVVLDIKFKPSVISEGKTIVNKHKGKLKRHSHGQGTSTKFQRCLKE